MENFRNDPLNVEATSIGLYRMFYQKNNEYYHVAIMDFYNRLQKARDSYEMKTEYKVGAKKKTFNISQTKIERILGSLWK